MKVFDGLVYVLFMAVALAAPGKLDGTPIHYGSVLRIRSTLTGHFLHSHEITLGPQGPNSVTGFNQDASDANSLWSVQEEHPRSTKTYKDAVQCGSIIMLQHLITEGRLKSFEGSTGLTSSDLQLVHSFRGEKDKNMNWKVVCPGKKEGTLSYGDQFQLLHVMTEKYVRFSNGQPYTEYNCGRGCTLQGQIELHAIKEGGRDTMLKAVNGMAIVVG